MVPRFRLAARLAGCLAVSVAAMAAVPASDLRPWVDRLAAADPADRAAAEAHLAAVGSGAIPTLSAALTDPRPDVADRARRALRRVRLFALRGATDESLDLANRYLSADLPILRGMIVQRMAELQPRPTDVLVRLIPLEPDARLRAQLLDATGLAYRVAVPRLVADGDGAALPPLLEQALDEAPYLAAADLAVDRWLTGGWDDAVARWRAELTNGDPAQQATAAVVLCHLYRVAGKSREAADVAGRAHDPRLRLITAIDAGDWSAAVDAAGQCWPGPQAAAVRVGLLQLAGRPAAELARAVDAAVAAPDVLPPAKVRLLVGDVTRGLDLLSADPTNGGDPVAAFALRRARGEYGQALTLADRFARDPQVGPAISAARDKLLQLLGERPADAETPVLVPAQSADPPWTQAVSDLAARRYAAAAANLARFDGDPNRIGEWYVRGFALDAAGDHAQGQQRMRAAALAPLADAAKRAALATRLAAAGLDAAAADQRALALRLANPFQEPVAALDLWLARGSAATAAGDAPAAVAAAERVLLLSFWPGLTWKEPVGYLSVPADVHLARARMAKVRGDWPTVLRELDAARSFLPGSADLPLEWVPALDAAGDHTSADQLFAAAYDRLDAESAKHPRSSYLHNQAAWLAACCCRRLDAAVAHAEAAVRLATPTDAWQYTDTLAECRFRLGDRSAAADLDRRAIGMPTADTAYLGRQVARFEKAPVPSTTRPATAPE